MRSGEGGYRQGSEALGEGGEAHLQARGGADLVVDMLHIQDLGQVVSARLGGG